MTVQVIKPSGAGYETVLVLALCAAIVALAGAVVSVRTSPDVTVGTLAHQFDARRDLNAAEQGLYADLRVAFDEIIFLANAQGGEPSVAALAEQGLPPFIQDTSAARRGAHHWQRVEQGGGSAYLGLSANVNLAGSMLLRLPHVRHDHGSPDIWLNRDVESGVPDDLDDAHLLAAGWRQIAAQFDAGVTRQQR